MTTSDYDFEITAETQYIEQQSEPDKERYVFAYTITIANVGTITAQLISRHWLITDAKGKVQEVRGDGVVGEQPTIEPGASFTYTSGAMLETPVGTMQGSYQMVGEDGLDYEAPIAAFRLSIPNILH